MQNQEKESKAITNLLETHNQEMAEMKKGTNIPQLKFEKLTEVIDKVISDYQEIKQSVRQWVERKEMVNKKVKWWKMDLGKTTD
jgi:ferritin